MTYCPFHPAKANVPGVSIVHVDYAGRDRSLGLCQDHLERALREGLGGLHTEGTGEDAGILSITQREDLIEDTVTKTWRRRDASGDCGCGSSG